MPLHSIYVNGEQQVWHTTVQSKEFSPCNYIYPQATLVSREGTSITELGCQWVITMLIL